jgi:hypothetical protein
VVILVIFLIKLSIMQGSSAISFTDRVYFALEQMFGHFCLN